MFRLEHIVLNRFSFNLPEPGQQGSDDIKREEKTIKKRGFLTIPGLINVAVAHKHHQHSCNILIYP